MNITLGIALLLIVIKGIVGYKKGMVKEVADCIALIITLIVIGVLLMIYVNFRSGETVGLVGSVILLVITGLIYRIIKIFFVSATVVSKLPILQVINSLLGIVVGVIGAFLIIWLVTIMSQAGFLGGIGAIINQDRQESLLLKRMCEYSYFIEIFQNQK